MRLSTQRAPIPVGREALDDADDRRKVVQRGYGADFWPMTVILIVVAVASLIALARIAELF